MLSVRNLDVTLDHDGEPLRVVDDVSLAILPGEILGLVGESGSGKTIMAMALMRRLPKHAQTGGEAWFDGADLLARPRHPYTRAPMRCVSGMNAPGVLVGGIPGSPPSPRAWPQGCRFRAR